MCGSSVTVSTASVVHELRPAHSQCGILLLHIGDRPFMGAMQAGRLDAPAVSWLSVALLAT